MNGKISSYADAISETVPLPLLVLDENLRVRSVNQPFLEHFQVNAEETEGTLIYDLGNGQWDIPDLRRLLEEILTRDEEVENYRVEHNFEEIGRRVFFVNARRLTHDRRPGDILVALFDVTEREDLIFNLEAANEFSEKLIDSVRESLLVLDWDLRVQSANLSFYETFQVRPEETEGKMIYDLGNRQWNIPKLRKLLEDILPKEQTFDDYEVVHDFPGIGRRTMILNARRLDHQNLILLAIRDVTKERRAALRQDMLVRELRHRVKNILSNVIALAHHTRRGNRTLEDFFLKFERRLAVLARVQDIIIESAGRKVSIENLIELELEALGAERGTHYTAEGPNLDLPAADIQALAMVFHELATNAAKYGALRGEGCALDIRWRIKDEHEGPRVYFHWRETGCRIENTDPPTGFGTRVIRNNVSYILGGSSSLVFHEDGVECTLEFDLQEHSEALP